MVSNPLLEAATFRLSVLLYYPHVPVYVTRMLRTGRIDTFLQLFLLFIQFDGLKDVLE